MTKAWSGDKDTLEDWRYNVASVVLGSDGRIYSLLVATDGEFFMSYVFSQTDIAAKTKLELEHEGWIFGLGSVASGEIVALAEGPKFLRFNGKKWKKEKVSGVKNLYSIRCEGTDVLLLGEGVVVRRDESEGGTWSPLTRGWKKAINDCSGALGCLTACGDQGLLIEEASPKWARIAIEPVGRYTSVASSADGSERWVAVEHDEEPAELIRISNGKIGVFPTECPSILRLKFWRGLLYAAAAESGLLEVVTSGAVGTVRVVNDRIRASSLYANDSVFAVAGGMRVAVFDGQTWGSKVFELD